MSSVTKGGEIPVPKETTSLAQPQNCSFLCCRMLSLVSFLLEEGPQASAPAGPSPALALWMEATLVGLWYVDTSNQAHPSIASPCHFPASISSADGNHSPLLQAPSVPPRCMLIPVQVRLHLSAACGPHLPAKWSLQGTGAFGCASAHVHDSTYLSGTARNKQI